MPDVTPDVTRDRTSDVMRQKQNQKQNPDPFQPLRFSSGPNPVAYPTTDRARGLRANNQIHESERGTE